MGSCRHSKFSNRVYSLMKATRIVPVGEESKRARDSCKQRMALLPRNGGVGNIATAAVIAVGVVPELHNQVGHRKLSSPNALESVPLGADKATAVSYEFDQRGLCRHW